MRFRTLSNFCLQAKPLVVFCFLILIAYFGFPVHEAAGQVLQNEGQANEVARKAARLIQSNYFDENVANKVSHELMNLATRNQFSRVRTKPELARNLSKTLLELTADKHLAVRWSLPTKTEQKSESAAKERREGSRRKLNSGIRKIEIMDGNIAYVEVTSFFRKKEVEDKFRNTMGLIKDAEAIIVDLRNNGGGSPEGVVELAAYFFEQNEVKLFDIVARDGQRKSYRTNRPNNQAWLNQPLVIITGPTTFSAGEGFAFIMQDQKRAKVIGSVTAGAANPGREHDIDEEFSIFIPNGKVVAANSQKNWEGKGVQPDILFDKPDILEKARTIAKTAVY